MSIRITADDTREALTALIADWRSVPRNGYDEEGRVRHDIEVDCADAVEAALAAARRDPEPVASVDAAWEALGEQVGHAIVARHRPAIEAAIRGTEAGRPAHKHGPLTWRDRADSLGRTGWACDVCGAFPVTTASRRDQRA